MNSEKVVVLCEEVGVRSNLKGEGGQKWNGRWKAEARSGWKFYVVGGSVVAWESLKGRGTTMEAQRHEPVVKGKVDHEAPNKQDAGAA